MCVVFSFFLFFLKNKQYMATQEKKVMIQITKGRIFLFFNDKFCLLAPVTGMLLVSHEFKYKSSYVTHGDKENYFQYPNK